MERLTERFENGQVGVAGCGKNCKYSYKYCENAEERCPVFNEIYEKLAAYEDAEDQEESLRLPISEDTPVYSIEYCCGNNKSNRSGMCFRGFCENCNDKAYYIRESVAKHCSICEINKSVFLTSEEAEAKLKEMEEASDTKE